MGKKSKQKQKGDTPDNDETKLSSEPEPSKEEPEVPDPEEDVSETTETTANGTASPSRSISPRPRVGSRYLSSFASYTHLSPTPKMSENAIAIATSARPVVAKLKLLSDLGSPGSPRRFVEDQGELGEDPVLTARSIRSRAEAAAVTAYSGYDLRCLT